MHLAFRRTRASRVRRCDGPREDAALQVEVSRLICAGGFRRRVLLLPPALAHAVKVFVVYPRDPFSFLAGTQVVTPMPSPDTLSFISILPVFDDTATLCAMIGRSVITIIICINRHFHFFCSDNLALR